MVLCSYSPMLISDFFFFQVEMISTPQKPVRTMRRPSSELASAQRSTGVSMCSTSRPSTRLESQTAREITGNMRMRNTGVP